MHEAVGVLMLLNTTGIEYRAVGVGLTGVVAKVQQASITPIIHIPSIKSPYSSTIKYRQHGRVALHSRPVSTDERPARFNQPGYAVYHNLEELLLTEYK